MVEELEGGWVGWWVALQAAGQLKMVGRKLAEIELARRRELGQGLTSLLRDWENDRS